jgi:vacuolar-type H+-ATPase subunit E/Vma4
MEAINHSSDVLCAEIVADARRESEEILQRARLEAEAVAARTATKADKSRHERLEQARAEAARRKELILATISLEADLLRSVSVETLLDTIREEATRQLSPPDGSGYRESVIRLASEALCRMEGDAFLVRLPQDDRVLMGDRLAEEIASQSGNSAARITISYEPAPAGGGPVIEDADARQVWDNRFLTRLERLWPELRRRIAQGASFTPSRPSEGGST